MAIDGSTLREIAIEVSQYFLDFLESGFKRQQPPRCRVILQTQTGFQCGMKIAPYADLQRDLWRLLDKKTSGVLNLKIQTRTYRVASIQFICKQCGRNKFHGPLH